MDVAGKIVMPGHIDTHAHLSGPFDQSGMRAYGHVMLAESGTTTALDLAGEPGALAEGMARKGAGMNVATLLGLVPHTTIKEDDPSLATMRDVISDALARGSIGVKLLGGLSPVHAGVHFTSDRSGKRADGMGGVSRRLERFRF